MSSVCQANVVFHIPITNENDRLVNAAQRGKSSLSKNPKRLTKVQIGRVHTINLDSIVAVHIVQDRIQVVDIPFIAIRIRNTAANIGTINGRNVCDIVPVLAFQMVVVQMFWRCISFCVGQFGELFDG